MDYLQALEKAVVYIEKHLGENITVKDVAREAGYSYYHLTRQFAAVAGEPIGSYIKKRRLADAAQQLLYTNKRVTDIALAYGFESAEVFSRAFKSVYRVSPVCYRKNRLDLVIGAKTKLEPEALRHLAANVTVQPRMVEMPETKVAGIRGQTTLNDNCIPQLWERFHTMRKAVWGNKPLDKAYGICETGETLYTMNGDAVFSEMVGEEVNPLDEVPAGFTGKVIRGGRYAVFTHRGAVAKLRETFRYIWGTWFLVTKEKLDEREDFELYDHRYLGYSHPESEIDLYIPVV